MVYVHATVLGGLPVVAEVWFSGGGMSDDDDAGVDGLYWRKRDGSRGAPLSQAMMDKIEARDHWWQADVTEQANDWLGCHCPTRTRNPHYRYSSPPNPGNPEWIVEGEYSAEWKLLNDAKTA